MYTSSTFLVIKTNYIGKTNFAIFFFNSTCFCGTMSLFSFTSVAQALLLYCLISLLICSSNIAAQTAAPPSPPTEEKRGNSYTHTRELKPPNLFGDHIIVPDIVHQTYDYKSPSLFLFLSLASVRVYHNPGTFYFWVNDEGRYRSSHWNNWLSKFNLKSIGSKSADFEFLSYLIRHAYQIYEGKSLHICLQCHI